MVLLQSAKRPEQLAFTGFVEGEEKVIKNEIPGRVNTVTFTDGGQVNHNGVLAEIDTRDYRSQVAQQELHLGLLKAKSQQAKNQLALARDTYPAQLRAAKTNLAKAGSDLDFAELLAPHSRVSVRQSPLPNRSCDRFN